MAAKMSSYCGIGFMVYVKDVALGFIHNPIPSLTYIFALTQIAFQVVNEVVGLTIAIWYGILGHATLGIQVVPV